jgi:hypothetical protein
MLMQGIKERLNSGNACYDSIQNRNYNSACGFVWVRNLASDLKGGTQTGSGREQGSEENIWT